MSVSLRAEKFNIVSNNHGRTHKCDFSVFDRKFHVQENSVQKKISQNCQFKLKLGTQTNSNMLNSMARFTFFVFDWNYPFQANLVKKNHNCQFKLKCSTLTNQNMQNSMVGLILFVLDWKYPFRRAPTTPIFPIFPPIF